MITTPFRRFDAPSPLTAAFPPVGSTFPPVLPTGTAMSITRALTRLSLAKLHRRHSLLGFLLAECLLTNVGGLLTLISSVPNIIVGQAADIGFMTFFTKAAPYVVIATLVTIWLARRMFKIEPLADEAERRAAAELVAGFDENDGVPSRGYFVFSAVALGLLIAAFSTASVIPYIKDLGLGFVAMFFAIGALLKYKHDVDKFYAAVDWDLLAFFGSLFIVINVMEHAQVLALIGTGLAAVTDLGPKLGPVALLWCSAIMRSVTATLPLSAILANIFSTAPAPPPTAAQTPPRTGQHPRKSRAPTPTQPAPRSPWASSHASAPTTHSMPKSGSHPPSTAGASTPT